jgi:hypothetical protein
MGNPRLQLQQRDLNFDSATDLYQVSGELAYRWQNSVSAIVLALNTGAKLCVHFK